MADATNRQAASTPPQGDHKGERVAKVIARAGICSRRDAERWIEAGRVDLNGKTLTSPAQNVTADDVLIVDGVPVTGDRTPRLWRYHKPAGRITTHKDPQGRPTVFEGLPPELPRVISVGRLDFNTEGLLLLTTNGDLARHLELPETGWLRRYRVRLHGRPGEKDFARLAEGMTVEGIRYASIDAKLERTQGANAWISMALREGKNREIRKVLGALGYEVSRLIRISYGPFQLGDLKPGTVEEIKPHVIRQQLGNERASQLGFAVRKNKPKKKRHDGPPAKTRPPT
ncbi:MAG: pseudouridine synthase [Hyphomicrobiaceae bacterium]